MFDWKMLWIITHKCYEINIFITIPFHTYCNRKYYLFLSHILLQFRELRTPRGLSDLLHLQISNRALLELSIRTNFL